MLSTDIYKTAHALWVKHGDTLIDALDEKLKVYDAARDEEAMTILSHIRQAAEQLQMVSDGSTMAH